jgi:hypothetical protein
VGCLPARGLVPHSQKYLASGPAAPAITAQYLRNGAAFTLRVSLASGAGRHAVVLDPVPPDSAAFLEEVKASLCGN